MRFIGRKIESETETVADQIKNARLQNGLDIEEVSAKTKINIKYLKAIEDSEYDKLPKGIYRTIFLRTYCEYLGLDWKRIEKDYTSETKHLEAISPEPFKTKRIEKSKFISFPKILRVSFTIILVAVFLVYISYYIKKSFEPPVIEILEPADNLITSDEFITVIGYTDEKAEIMINGKSVLAEENGLFRQELDLKKGVNTIVISAKKKYGPKTTVQKQILVE